MTQSTETGSGAEIAPGLLPVSLPSRKIRKWVTTGLFLLVAVGGSVGYWRYREAHRPPDVQYKTAPVEQKRIVGRVTASLPAGRPTRDLSPQKKEVPQIRP